jgi:hypothetical protein
MKVLASTYAICLNGPPSPRAPLAIRATDIAAGMWWRGSREAFGARGDHAGNHAAGPLMSKSCFSDFEVSRA